MVSLTFERDLCWVFRPEEHNDTGLDAHVEEILRGERQQVSGLAS